MCGLVLIEKAVPLFLPRSCIPRPNPRGKLLIDTIGHKELLIFRPTIAALREADFLLAERFSMRGGGILLESGEDVKHSVGRRAGWDAGGGVGSSMTTAGPADPASGARGEVEQVLRLYQEIYADFKVRRFHEKLVEEHGIRSR